MTDQERKTMEMALEALEWHVSRTRPIEKTTEAIEALRQALDHVPDTMKMLEPDMGIDRGAWDDVPDATKWVDELRGGDETEQEPVAKVVARISGVRAEIHPSLPVGTPLYTAPPSNSEQGCGECGVKASEGYALYCVKCVEPMFKKEWVSLTDEDITEAFVRMRRGLGKYTKFAQIIEAKLREKNT